MKILVTADWHIRGDRPRCRIDENWLETQRQDIRAVREVARKHRVDAVWILGDLFHQPRCATEAVNMTLSALGELREVCPVRILAGNHDLPYHDFKNLDACSLGIVYHAGHCPLDYRGTGSEYKYNETRTTRGEWLDVYAAPFGEDRAEELDALKPAIWTVHVLTFPSDKDRPAKDVGVTADELLDAAPSARVILTGDYHHGYMVTRQDGRKVITPGCLNIQVADMADYRPRVYILDTDTLDAEPVYLEGHAGDIVTDYLVEQQERDERMEKVLEVVGDGVASLDFMGNLDREIDTGNYPKARKMFPWLKDTLNKDRT